MLESKANKHSCAAARSGDSSDDRGMSGEGSLFDQHPDAVFELDLDCVLVHLNPSACRMLGHAPGNLAGAPLAAIAAPERVEPDMQQLRATLGGEVRVFDSTGVASDGRRIRVQITSIPRLVDGRVAGSYAIVKNVDAERRMHEQLAASEARLRAILDYSRDAVLLSDPLEDRLLECNRAAEQLFGRSEAELLQCSREQLFDLESTEWSEFIRRRDDNGYARGIVHLVRTDGRRIPVEASSAMFRDGRGRWCSSVMLRDISERRRREQELTESERRYRALFEQSADAILLSRPDGTIDHANPAAERMFGCSVDELRRLGRSNLIDEDEPAFLELSKKRRSSKQVRGEIQMYRADGERFLADISIVEFEDGSGQARTSIVVRDVTEQRHNDERLRASEERFRTVFEHSPDAIVILDPETGRNLDANPAAERLLKRSRQKILELSRDQDVVKEPGQDDFIRRRVSEGTARVICKVICGDGEHVPVDMTSATFLDSRGQLRAVSMIRDISEQIERERRLRQSEQRFRIVANHTGQVVYEVDLERNCVEWSGNCMEMFGFDEAALSRMSAVERLEHAAAEDRERIAETYRRAIATGQAYQLEYRVVSPRGKFIDVDDRGVVLCDPRRVYGVLRDVTERKELYRQLDLLASAFRGTNEALLVCDFEWRVLDANRAYEAMVGLARQDIIGEQPSFLEFGDQSGLILERVEADGQWRGELLLRDAEGMLKTTRVGISEILGSHGSGPFLVVHLEDLSQIREFQRRIDFLSYNDGLTGLPNRSALQHWFSEMSPAPVLQQHLAVVYLDLDRFKAINESFGHSVGDKILIEVGRRLRGHCGKADFVARLGGDDFVIVLTTVDDTAHALRRTADLIRELAMPIEAAGQKIFSSASAGIVFCPGGDGNMEDLLRRADAAHAAAKRHGRGQLQLYDGSMQREVEEHALVETHLREALRQGELYLVYQPIVDLRDGRITGLEALARWNNPELGDVPPARFVPVAEESGLIVELGAWIFDQACVEVRTWLDAGVPFGALSVNISPAQFQQPDFVDRLAQCLAGHDLTGEHFVIEITENVLMLDPERAAEILHQLRGLGMRIAVDDFGTGYSSMAYLRQFPVQGIKLDRAFISTIPESHVDATIIRSVIDLAGALDLHLIAEGIETEEQRQTLVQWGCKNGQGFLFSKPHRTARITEMLLENRSLDMPQDGSAGNGNRR
ncbi:MAG: PAS domain S-box protein [Wenzhouxiangellaceae bacterium]|nr:PAS domain S-box protein [Wenzhouxiangellaceae bacterium]